MARGKQPAQPHPNEQVLQILFAHCDQVVVGRRANVHLMRINSGRAFSCIGNSIPNVMNTAVWPLVTDKRRYCANHTQHDKKAAK